MTPNNQAILQPLHKAADVVLVPSRVCPGFADQALDAPCAEMKAPAPCASGQPPTLSAKRRKHAVGQRIEGL